MDAVATQTTDLIGRVRALVPLVDAERRKIDAERRLPTSLFSALAEAGLFRLWLPRALGGPELSPLDFMEVVEATAEIDGSVGWIVGNGAGAGRIAGYVPEEVARYYFDDRHSFMVTATGAVGNAVPVPGGYRVTGRWPYGSGIHGATAVAGLCAVSAEDGPPRQIMCLVPASAVTVFDTWDVSGLRGTGSCDWAIKDVFVPEEHAFSFPDQRATQPGLVYRLPSLSTFTWSVSVVPLALARACLTAFLGMAGDRVRVGTNQPLRDRETIQSEVGHAEARLRAARAFLVEAMGALMDAVEHGQPNLVPFRADVRLAAAHAADTALRVASALEAAIGAAALFESGPLARRLRDLRAAVQHVAMSPNNFIIAGRLQLGLDPGTTRI